ncbi:Signal transduction histidine kinase [Streptomyces sp. 1222.5]|uniref:sensor histidine kinase n=1 Tax=unclassified Streptomyces TaxID=2593676 RepID=UPI00089D356B|nr:MULTISPECIES: HAMP domain-containing sensor histidine kinase [unclassified Streptomyces]PKW12154.1 signal transduction histidine kinase [Streptomyces sp. 5112.2]SEB61604.1 Signal transduction histidine kinase [Streptomyces sp. 1222.5]
MPRPFASVRARAALAATAVVSIALVAAGILVVAVLRHNLTERAGLEAEVTARTVAGAQAALNGDFGTLDLPDDEDDLVQVADASGKVVAAGDELRGRGVISDYAPAPAPEGTASGGRHEDDDDNDDHGHDSTPARGKVGTEVGRRTLTVRVGDESHEYRFAAVQGTTYDGRTYTVYAGASLADEQATSDQVVRAMLTGLPCLLVVVAGVTWLVTRRALGPVEGIRAEMAEITGSGDLARRVPEPGSRDEIARLARTTNQTLAALEQSVERQHRFVADASHELRSPIASLRTQLEVAEQHSELLDVPDLLQDVVRLQHLAADLLLLARLDAGERPLDTLVDLDALVREEVARRARIDRITPAVTAADTALEVKGSRNQLSRVLGNLLDNAQRHASTGITVTVDAVGDAVVLTVADDGDGVAPADRTRVFERFVRLDEGRSRDEGGAALGLAIARDVVSRHDGTLTLTDAPAGGAAFRISLPRAR